MASLRLLVLDFVRAYILEWRASPSYGEIAAHLQTNRMRIRRAVWSLAGDGLLLRTPGPRGLSLPDERDEALRKLRALGWQIDEAGHRVTNRTLLPPPALDYLPDDDEGESSGITGRAGADEGKGRSAAGDQRQVRAAASAKGGRGAGATQAARPRRR